MESYRSAELPADPSQQIGWQPATGSVWGLKLDKPFQLDDQPPLEAGWIVWDDRNGYRCVDNPSFDRDYELTRSRTAEGDPGETDSFGLG